MATVRMGRAARPARWALTAVAGLALVFGAAAVPSGTVAAQPVSGSLQAGSPGDTGGVVVERAVAEEVAADGAADFWVVFDQAADTDEAQSIDGWAARGEYVYQELTETAAASQAGVAADLDARGVEFEAFWIVNAILVRGGDQATLNAVSADGGVAQVRAHRSYQLPEPVTPESADKSDPAGESESAGESGAAVDAVEWGIANIRADQVWADFGARGQGIVVGNIDTGVQFDHPALDDQYRGNNGDGTLDHAYNWWDPSQVCGSPSVQPCDNNGHGTHTMGTMVGDDTDDGGSSQVGVAPQADWIAAKGCEGRSCSESALLSSGQFMLAPTDLSGENPRPELRPHIVNNSWGGPAVDTFYDEVVAAWTAAGIFPVFSNGNAGPSCGTASSPADGPDAYAVGAYDVNNAIASFSSRGAGRNGEIRPDIAAPGANVRSSFPGNRYATASGTSMAAPHVAGAVALLWSAAPDLQRDVQATRDVLDAIAVDVDDTSCGGTAADNNVFGQGRLDALTAVSHAAIGPLPDVRITEPAGKVVVTEGDPVTFTATAVDFNGDDLSPGIEWASDLDGVLGTGASVTTSSLSWGLHTITATATDDPGRSGSATVTVDIVSRIDVQADGRRVQGRHQVDLFWQGPKTRMVDIHRDGELLVTVENSGFHLDNIGARGGATYVYQVCEADTTVCSDDVTVRFGS